VRDAPVVPRSAQSPAISRHPFGIKTAIGNLKSEIANLKSPIITALARE
jgi:hypothetical protein